jgi:hypothetical protein
METIIQELKRDTEDKEGRETEEEAMRSDEQQRVLEAINEGFLQVHRIAPNTKQDGIFQLMQKMDSIT